MTESKMIVTLTTEELSQVVTEAVQKALVGCIYLYF